MTRLTVRRGSTGSIVVELQRKLNMLGYYHGKPHGTFDAETEKAVIALQRAEGLIADGNVDIKTWAVLSNKRTKPHPHSAPPFTRRGPASGPIKDLPKPPPAIFPMPKHTASKPGNAGMPNPKRAKDDKVGSPFVPPARDKATGAIAVLPEAKPVISSEPDQHFAKQPDDTAASNPKDINTVEINDIADPPISEEVAYVIAESSEPIPQVSSPPEYRGVLQQGDTGSTVQTLQMMLQILGYYNGRINGIFDSSSKQAVIAFQSSNALNADGVVSPKIWAALDDAITAHLPKQPSSPLPAPESRPILKFGNSGETVQVLQMMVQLLDYYDGPVNSVFDETTMQAVTAFQNGNGLIPDGVVDPQTWKQLDNAILNLPPLPPVGLSAETHPSLLPGDTGEAVKVLQMMLYILSFYNASINSIFDETTKRAVIDFQKNRGLAPSNIVGSSTWKALNKALTEHMPTRPLTHIPSSASVLSSSLSSDSAPSLSPASLSAPELDVMPVSNTINRSTVRLGDTGAEIESLKKILTDLGYYTGPINQTFDALLSIAVTCFQRDYDLVPDGIVGPLTWAALESALNSPSQPSHTTLRLGDVSKSVVYLQGLLRFLCYYNGPITKKFTAKTQAAVQHFQRDKNLVVDGIVGPLTWAALDETKAQYAKRYPVIRLGETGHAVARLQRLLANIGLYSEPVNSIYSEKLADSVKEFQANQGLAVDGITGPMTWQTLETWQSLHARDNISLCWVQNPNNFAISTDAFNVISPVWYDLFANDENPDINPRQASAAYTKVAHNRGINVWGTIQSFDAALTRRLVTSDAEITEFINKMKGFSAAHQLDGLCIDFEYMYVEDKDIFTEFVRRVSAALKSDAASRNKQFVICVCFSPPPHPDNHDNMWSACVDRAALGLICDYCCLMLYDETGPDSSGPIASQSWATEGLRQTLEQVSPNVLLLGAPFYSAKWSSRTDNTAMYLTMDMIQNLLDKEHFTDRNGSIIKVSQYIVRPAYRDGELYAEFVDTGGDTHKIWAHTPQSVSTRLALVSENNLPGAVFWEYAYCNKAAWDIVGKELRGL